MNWWLKLAILSPALWVYGFWYPQAEPAHMLFLVLVGGVGLSRTRWNLLRHAGSTPAASKTLAWALGVWATSIVTTTLWSSSPLATIFSTHSRGEGALQNLLYVVFLVALISIERRDEMLRWLVWMCGATLVLGVTSYGWLDYGPPGWPRFTGGLGNPLYLAALMPFGIWAALKLKWWHAAIVFAAALVATLGKGAILGLVVAGIFWLWHTQRYLPGFLATLGLTGGLLALPTSESGNIRMSLWTAAVKGIWERPWGWGAENYGLIWDRFFMWTDGHTGWHDRAHNAFLDRTIEWGVVGAAAWFLILVLAYRKGGPLEKTAFVAYAVGAVFMFDMLPSMVGLLCLAAYCLHSPLTLREKGYKWEWTPSHVWLMAPTLRRRLLLGVVPLAAALLVAGLSLVQSWELWHSRNYQDLLDAAAIPSPIGGFGTDVAEKYLQQPQQNSSTLDAIYPFVPTAGPERTTLLYLLAIHDRGRCPELVKWAPNRLDVQLLCPKVDKPPGNGTLGVGR